MLTFIFLLIVAYGLGSLSSAMIVSRLFHLPDPRLHGSKNAGATNVLRLGGKIPAALTLLGDIAKGTAPVLLGKYFQLNDMVLVSLLLAALLGHVYPIFFGFKGGKGIATAWGGLLGFHSGIAGLISLIWLGTALVFRISSLASITAALSAPFIVYLCTRDLPLSAMIVVLSFILIMKHKTNIQRLCLGTEPRIGEKK